MNDFDLNPFNGDDIKKIQEDIIKDLQEGAPPPLAYGDAPHEAPAAPPQGGYAGVAPAAPQDSVPINIIRAEKNGRGKGPRLNAVIAALIIAVVGCPLLGLCIGIGSGAAKNYFNKNEKTPEVFSFDKSETITPVAATLNPSSIIDDFSAIVDLCEPSVVGITSMTKTENGSLFFPQTIETPSKGSGIIFDTDAENVYIVTNYHVVADADSVGVSVSGRDPVNATFVGAEEGADIAVITIKAEDLKNVGVSGVTVAKFGTSADMKVGEVVLAIGNALGEGNTATLGILSAKEKVITVEGLKLSVMQTDAAINPGNSGGPLVNAKGEVIAINTAKFQYYDVEGTGYSIPIDLAKPIIERVRNKTPRPFLGVYMDEVSAETAEMFSIPAMGVLVVDVIEGSPAKKAGILKNDIITSFNEKPVLTTEDLTALIAECNIGDAKEVKLYRLNEGALTLEVTLAERPVISTF